MGTGVALSAAHPPAGARWILLGFAFAGGDLLTLSSWRSIRAGAQGHETDMYLASNRSLFVFVAMIFLLGLLSVAYLVTLAPL